MIIRCVPRRVGHAVAPGVEMGLLDGVLVLVHDFFPAAEMVGEDVVEAVGGAVPHMDGHHVATGADVVELACDTARGRHLMEAGHAGHGLLEGVALVEPRMPPHALRIIVEGETVAVLGDADGKVPEAVGHVAGGGGNGGAVAAPDLGDSMGTAADVGVGSRGGAGRDVARAVVGDTVHTRAVHRVGDQAVEVVVFECLCHRCGVFPFLSKNVSGFSFANNMILSQRFSNCFNLLLFEFRGRFNHF